MLNTGQIVTFNSAKSFKYIKPLGKGGTGGTWLFEDETTDTLFAIKKYEPEPENDFEENYDRFVQEVKILFSLSHKNVVRIYNHYLFPERKLGYLQMEYIDGKHIDCFVPYPGKDWNDVFSEIIDAFCHLEDNHVLHRDIRPANILIDINGTAKIIDFGFGKKSGRSAEIDNSVYLNWPVSRLPQELENKETYNHKTDMYFLGKLFLELNVSAHGNFRHSSIINKMSEYSPKDRYKNFAEIASAINEGDFTTTNVSEKNKKTYQKFAFNLTYHIASYYEKLRMERDSQIILSSLFDILQKNSFEDNIQDVSTIIRCIVKQPYSYYDRNDFPVEDVKNFYNMFNSLKERERQILLDNLATRLDKIKVKDRDLGDVPF